MKTLLLLSLCFGIACSTLAGTCDVGLGTIEAPEEFVFERGSTDSVLGTLIRKSDGFTINFDVGGMAGIHMHKSKKAGCTFFRQHLVGGLPAATGIEATAEGRRVTISIGDVARMHESPANFWANLRNEADLAEFLLIVTTYKEKAGAGLSVPPR